MHACSAHSLRHARRNELVLLGLSRRQLAGLLTRQFPHLPAAEVAALAPTAATAVLPSTHAAFVTTLHAADERRESRRRPRRRRLSASIVAHACLRPDHLWRDLGRRARRGIRDARSLFPALAARNVAHLRWKKFLAQKWPPRSMCRPPRVPGLRGFRLLLSSRAITTAATGAAHPSRRIVAHLRWKKFLAQEVAAALDVPPAARAARISASAFLTRDNHRGDRAAHPSRRIAIRRTCPP